MKHRVTVRGHGLELRGFIDSEQTDLVEFSNALNGFGLVIASPMEPMVEPFDGQPDLEGSRAKIMEFLADVPDAPTFIERVVHLHFMQAMVIRGERDRAERAESELQERELHHFETEQENERLRRTHGD